MWGQFVYNMFVHYFVPPSQNSEVMDCLRSCTQICEHSATKLRTTSPRKLRRDSMMNTWAFLTKGVGSGGCNCKSSLLPRILVHVDFRQFLFVLTDLRGRFQKLPMQSRCWRHCHPNDKTCLTINFRQLLNFTVMYSCAFSSSPPLLSPIFRLPENSDLGPTMI